MKNEVAVKDFYGKIIGFIETKPNGDKVVRDFYRRILGRYDKKTDATKDFFGRILYRGDNTGLLLSTQSK